MARRPAPVPASARRHRLGPACALLVSLLLVTGLATAPRAAAEQQPEHRPPVDAPVTDPFRPPADPWGSGNRGLEYGTEPGTPVAATADGVVVFAGRIAGSRHVTIRHEDGVRTSYSFLAEVRVLVGQHVRQGDVVGTTEHRLHLGARLGEDYFDPATLFEGGPPRVRLVPFELPLGGGERGERRAIRQLIGGVGGLLGDAAEWVAGEAVDRLAGAAGLAGDWLYDQGGALLRTLAHYAVPYPYRIGRAVYRALSDAHRVAMAACTPTGVPPRTEPRGRRIAVRVGGLGSTSDAAAIDDLDLQALGYAEADIARFSYLGGTTPGRGDALAALAVTEYASADTQVDLWDSGAALADLIEAVVAEVPGTPIDVFAHSQGGLVARAAIVVLVDRHGPGWVREHLDEVVTLGTPHGGADLATAVVALQSLTVGDRALEVGEWLTGLDADAPAAAQLAETSDFQRQLEDRWPEGLVDLTSIAARGDLVVAVPRTKVGGSTHVVVPVDGLTAHDALPGSDHAAREVALAVADQPPTCRSFDAALIDGLVGEGISLVEDGLGSLAWGLLGSRSIPRG